MRRLAVAVGGVAVLAVGGVAFAQSSGDGQIYACVSNGDGSVRVKATADVACPKNWSPLSWSQQGPQGEQGVPGVPGVQGDPGDKGDPGPGGVKIVLASRTVTVPRDAPVYRTECVRELFGNCLEHEQVLDHFEPGTAFAQATCPTGTQSMGDGKAEGVSFGVSGTGGQPVGYTGWRGSFSNDSHGEGTGRIEVRCVEVAEITTVAG